MRSQDSWLKFVHRELEMRGYEFQELLDKNQGQWQNRVWTRWGAGDAWDSGNYRILIDYNLDPWRWIVKFKSVRSEFGSPNPDTAWKIFQHLMEDVWGEISARTGMSSW